MTSMNATKLLAIPKHHQVQGTKLLKVRDVAILLGVSVITVRRRVKANTLPHFRISGQIYFKLVEINTFVEVHRGANLQWTASEPSGTP